MATQPAESRSERVVVLMTPTEKRDIAEKARELGMSMGEYMRLTAEFGAMTPAEQQELETLAMQLRLANERTSATLDRLDRLAAEPFDEDALRAKYRAELAAMDVDWAQAGQSLGLHP